MPNAYISGTGYHVPERVVTNQDLVTQYGIDTTDEWIQQRTGIVERRFADAGVGNADLALPAARSAIASAGLDVSDIDMIVYATLSPDHVFPGSGVYLQAKLGCPGVPAMDIRNQCSGFVYGLSTAAAMVQSGAVRNVLLVGSEVHSAALDLTTRGRAVASLFGDGAGAVVVSATDEDRGIRTWHLGADGRHADMLCQRVWDISERPFIPHDDDGNGVVRPEMMFASMNGKQVFKNAVEKMIASLTTVCQRTNIGVEDLDLVLFHQANKRINEMVRKMAGIPEDKLPHNIERYGNTTAATIPLLLAEQHEQGKLERGMKIGMVAFGSGFTWGAALLEW